MANEIKAGGAYVEIFVKGNIGPQLDQVAKKLKSIGDSVTNLGKKFATIGAAITAPLVASAVAFAKVGDEINKASQRTGIGVEALQELSYAASQSGASFEDLEAGIRKMQKAVFAAADGNKEAEKSFASLGLSVIQLKSLSPDQQFTTIAQSLSKVHNEAARTAIALEIFGKGGTKLLPLLESGSAGIAKLVNHAKSLGLVFSQQDAEAATRFHDTLDDLEKQLGAVVFQVGSAVANALQPFATAATHCLASVIAWVKENKSLVLAVFAGGVAFLAAGAAIVTFGIAIKTVGVAISGMLDGFKFVTTVLGLMTNPIVLIGVALAALGGYLLYTSGLGGRAVEYLTGKFYSLLGVAKEVFGGIADALSAGDISLAAKILWVGLQTAWAEGTADLQKKWIDFKAAFVQTAAAAFYGFMETWATVKQAFLESWANIVLALKTMWVDYITWVGAKETLLANKALSVVFNNKEQMNNQEAIDANKKNLQAQVAAGRLTQAQADKMQKNFVADTNKYTNKANAERDKENQALVDKMKADAEKEKSGFRTAHDADVNSSRRDLEKAIKKINDDEQSLSAGADAQAAQEKKDLEAKKAALQKQLDALRLQAKSEGDKAKADDRPMLGYDRAADLDNIIAQRGAIDLKSAGLFNVAGLQSLQGGKGGLAEVAANTRAIADNTKGFRNAKQLAFK